MFMNKSFCILPWIHFNTRSDSYIRLCCYAKQSSHLVNNKTVDEIRTGPYLSKIRSSMLKGDRISECEICQNEEIRGIESKRQRENKIWESKINYSELTDQVQKLRSVDIRFDNICTLKCVMCNPGNSSAWENDFKKYAANLSDPVVMDSLGWPNTDDLYYKNSIPFKKQTETIQSIFNHLTDIETIRIGGGEPLLSQHHAEFIDKLIESRVSSRMTLIYNTNGLFINNEHIVKWNRFKKIIFHLSIDGLREVNDYIRYPSKWGQVEKSLDSINRIQAPVQVHFELTMQALNLPSFSKFLDWKLNLPYHFVQQNRVAQATNFHLLQSPSILSVSVLSEELIKKSIMEIKSHIRNHFTKAEELSFIDERYSQLENFALNGKSEQLNDKHLVHYLNALDKVRNSDYRTIFSFLVSQRCGMDSREG